MVERVRRPVADIDLADVLLDADHLHECPEEALLDWALSEQVVREDFSFDDSVIVNSDGHEDQVLRMVHLQQVVLHYHREDLLVGQVLNLAAAAPAGLEEQLNQLVVVQERLYVPIEYCLEDFIFLMRLA